MKERGGNSGIENTSGDVPALAFGERHRLKIAKCREACRVSLYSRGREVPSNEQRYELQAYPRKHTLPAAVAQRMRIVMLSADGATCREIMKSLETTDPTLGAG